MTGGAVTATVADGSAAFYNPAGLALSDRNRIDVSASAYGLRFYSVESFLSVKGGPAKDASVTEFVAIPTQIAYARKFGERWTLGVGYFVPRASNTLLSERLEGVAASGTASTMALDARVSSASSWLTAAAAVQLSPRLRLGFAVFGVYDESVQSTTFFGSVQENAVTQKALEFTSLGTSTQISSTLGVGAQFDPSPSVSLGLWARGPQLRILTSGSTSTNLVGGSPGPDGTPLVVADSSEVPNGERTGFLTLGRYVGALAYRTGATMISVECDVQPGLRSERTGVDRRFTLNARAGVTYRVGESILLGAGAFTDRSVDAQPAFRIDYYGGTLGVELADVLALARGEPRQQRDSLMLTSVFALRYAYGHGRTDTLVADPSADLANTLSFENHTQSAHEFSLHVGSSLRF